MKAIVEIDNRVEFEEQVESLLEVLREHVEAHRELMELLEAKRDALVAMNADGLERVLEQEPSRVRRITENESRRAGITRSLAASIGSSAGAGLRLAELILHVDSEAREEILEIRDELRSLARRLDRLNSLNRTMAIRSMDHFHGYIAMLSGRDPDARTYTKKGMKEDDGSSLIVDHQA